MPSTPAKPPRLTGEALRAGYASRHVLDGVDLAVAEGKLTVLLGPNGSGKSTLLKTLARTLTPSAGRVCLDGKDIHRRNTREVAQRLGILPQGPSAPEGLTVRQLVGMGRFPHQRLWQQDAKQDARAIREAMAYADVTDFAERSVDALSGGQRQRCWIAMILAQETDLVLLDEPTTFLDLCRTEDGNNTRKFSDPGIDADLDAASPRQTGVPVERLDRHDENPRVSFWGLVRLAKTAIFSFSTAPLSLFYLIAIVSNGFCHVRLLRVVSMSCRSCSARGAHAKRVSSSSTSSRFRIEPIVDGSQSRGLTFRTGFRGRTSRERPETDWLALRNDSSRRVEVA